ncbi:TetR family transcriptional regulator [Alisedimentitalea sp. MJ-SS2]|uniref:TetR/AcrR family transcriptional regulator n=1 Tax=Aliisedimentitalea sp. MJ-SS2 TaxID=3049795 RepID=UPI00290E84B0|nr:TetR family transcriptional regulator [Alisedimentitalea sp. MJ-SS2]MDU8929531.1 TetR family transcriptional regulator [Alisedimentitalea sp. MJ-SS2]
MKKQRLSPDLWIEAGLNALEKHGPAALGAEPLARQIGATKGSFYWHFKDLPDYHAQLAGTWKRRAAGALVDALEATGPVADRLAMIAAPIPAEPEMRVWARSNVSASAQLTEIDHLRLDATAALLRDFGISNPDLARALYAASVGMAALPGNGDNATALETLVDLVLALR